MTTYQYGIEGPEGLSQLEVELKAFLLDPPESVGGLGRHEHFWNIVNIVWPKTNKIKHFERNPWTERMVVEACRNNYVALSGCASSGKTDFAAVWAIINWLCSPADTLVFCTSTSLRDSNRRIWGRIKQFWQAAPGLPGKLVDSRYCIQTDTGSGTFTEEHGISCIAGEKKDEKEAVGKLIGAHPNRLILIVDEMPEITQAILSAALSNMAINPWFQMIGIGNFKSRYDTFGQFAKPKGDYGSVGVEDEEWETEHGICLRFDGMKSPNILTGEDKYACYNSKNLAAHKKNFGEDSAEFWRMCRSFPAPTGLDNVIYSEADILAGKAESTECVWTVPPTKISALDPSFTNGGDNAVQMIGSYGICTDGVWRIRREETIVLHENVTDPAPRDYQIARLFRDNCVARGVAASNAALDTTGAGSVLYSILCEEWSSAVLQVNFSGSPSELFVRANDSTTADKAFDRRVSELWWVGREFMKYGQIRGLNESVCRELKARQYVTVKGPDGLKVSVELKKDMKKRLGFSPDEADCLAVMLDLCRQRLGALAGGVNTGERKANDAWEKQVQLVDEMYSTVNYSEQPVYESSSIFP